MSDPTICDVELVERRAESIRDVIFEAQAIVDLSAAATVSENVSHYSLRRALKNVSNMLDRVASRLEPGAITQAATASERAEVSHGQA